MNSNYDHTLNSFLENYASGLFKHTKVQDNPDDTLLILDDRVKATNRQLANLKRRVAFLLKRAILIVRHIDYLQEMLQAILAPLIKESVSIDVEGLSVEMPSKGEVKLIIFLECNESQLASDIDHKIVNISESILRNLGYNCVLVTVTSRPNTNIAENELIRVILEHAPISINGIAQVLSSISPERPIQEHHVATLADRLRKKDLIIWQPSKTYVPTRKALSLFSSAKSRNSSDIKRALELGRKKW